MSDEKYSPVWDALDSRPWDGAVLPSGRELTDEEWEARWDQAKANVAAALAETGIRSVTVTTRIDRLRMIFRRK